MINWILQPWPWWLSGILIGLTVPAMYLFANKSFGISSSLRHIGSMCTPNSGIAYLRDNNWRSSAWSIVFIVGIMIGGFIANFLLSAEPVEFLPASYYSLGGFIQLLLGGVLVGFGTRYANGCTSGHAITGISNLNWPSMVATAFFFVGGLFTTWVLGSWLF